MIMRNILRLAVSCLAVMTAFPAFSQKTDDYLIPSGYTGVRQPLKFVSKDISTLISMEETVNLAMSNNNKPSSRKDVCWGEKVAPSFEESYEIQCIRDYGSESYCLQLTVENQDNPYVLEIDDTLAYQIGTLFDAAVYSASYLPAKEWMQSKVSTIKAGGSLLTAVGVDGTTFNFFNYSYGAQCWSPRDGNNARLVSVGRALYDAIAHKDLEPVKAMLPEIKSLTESYASLLQDPYREYFLLRIDMKPGGFWWLSL